MPEFRKLILALCVVVLFAGLASAQVGTQTGGFSTGAFTCGVTNGAVTPTLRSEGFTELTGDIVIICSGGSPAAIGSTIPTANITLFLNTTVTSRLLPTSSTTNATASEALLLVDEPGSQLAGYGPQAPQTICTNAGVAVPQVGAGLGGCVEEVGITTTTPAGPSAGVPILASSASALFVGTPGPNVFQGVTAGNQVTFYGIPVQPPVSAGLTRVFRITNVRVNANGVVAGGATPGSVTASLSINSSTSLAITNSTLTVGFVQQGLNVSGTGLRNSANTGSSGGANLNQCSSASVTSTSSTSTSPIGNLQFQENFATAFKIREATTTAGSPTTAVLQNVPGFIYNSESGFILPGLTGFSAIGSTLVAGLADYGTRLKATFNNVPSGVSLYVSTRDVTNEFNTSNITPYATAQAVLVVSEAASDGGIGVGPAQASASTNYVDGSITGVPIAPVAINAATGTGLAVWEVINTNPATIDTIDFALYINYSANVAANSPTPGSITVTLSYAPTPSGGAFTTSTGPAASASLVLPRFADNPPPSGSPKTIATINLCNTALLFPYVINVNGFDTGLAIANTTTDPFGTAAQAGVCSLYFYGSSAPTTIPFVTPTVATGTVYANLASTLAPGFSGYMIANCNFQLAHGFAFVSDVGARNLAMGYLPLILTRSGTSPEALNN
jgi:hypothetical protein